jgi:hypothetical protein
MSGDGDSADGKITNSDNSDRADAGTMNLTADSSSSSSSSIAEQEDRHNLQTGVQRNGGGADGQATTTIAISSADGKGSENF